MSRIMYLKPTRVVNINFYDLMTYSYLWQKVSFTKIVSISEIARMTGLSRNTVSPSLLHLIELKLVEKKSTGHVALQPPEGWFYARQSKTVLTKGCLLIEGTGETEWTKATE